MVGPSPLSSLVVLRSGENCGKNESEPLILTPWIQNGEITKAQGLSKVETLKGLDSYSGFLTVNQTFNANMFFWFFPSQKTGSVDLVSPQGVAESQIN